MVSDIVRACIAGTIPTELGGIPMLTDLDLSHNSLEGEHSPELGACLSVI